MIGYAQTAMLIFLLVQSNFSSEKKSAYRGSVYDVGYMADCSNEFNKSMVQPTCTVRLK